MRLTDTVIALETALMSTGYTNSVYMGDVYNVWNNTNVPYVSACYDISRVGASDDAHVYQFIVYVADRLVEGEKNLTQALDACEAVLDMAVSKLRVTNGILDVIVDFYIPFSQKFADNLAGYYGYIDVKVKKDIDNC